MKVALLVVTTRVIDIVRSSYHASHLDQVVDHSHPPYQPQSTAHPAFPLPYPYLLGTPTHMQVAYLHLPVWADGLFRSHLGPIIAIRVFIHSCLHPHHQIKAKQQVP